MLFRLILDYYQLFWFVLIQASLSPLPLQWCDDSVKDSLAAALCHSREQAESIYDWWTT